MNPMKKRSILVVDDEKNIRSTMKKSLETKQISVSTAVNGEEALEKLQRDSFDLVFLDLKLPGMDGMEILRRTGLQWPGTRTIIVTAHGTVETAVEAMKLGAADFLRKPFTPGEIRELTQQVLNRETLDEDAAEDYPSWIDLTKRHISDRNFSKAREAARNAIAADPERPEAYNLLGALLEIKGDWLNAQKYYRAALDMDPTFRPAKTNLERTATLNKFGKIELGPEKSEPDTSGRGGDGKPDEEP